MPTPRNLDFDRFFGYVLRDIGVAINRWLGGFPNDETSLLNHITGVIGSRRGGCDIGLESPMVLKPLLVELHRQGATSVDRFGGDLAVTLYADDRRYAKTAFFQLKKSTRCKVQLERRQLLQAREDERIWERSFVLAVDEVRKTVRVTPAREALNRFVRTAAHHSENSANWSSVSGWLRRWLSCREAPSSDLRSADAVETLLVDAVPDPSQFHDRWPDLEPEDAPEGFLPARVWLPVEIQDARQEELFAPPGSHPHRPK